MVVMRRGGGRGWAMGHGRPGQARNCMEILPFAQLLQRSDLRPHAVQRAPATGAIQRDAHGLRLVVVLLLLLHPRHGRTARQRRPPLDPSVCCTKFTCRLQTTSTTVFAASHACICCSLQQSAGAGVREAMLGASPGSPCAVTPPEVTQARLLSLPQFLRTLLDCT